MHILKQALSRTRAGKNAMEKYINNQSTDIKGSVDVTLAATLDPLRIVANLWYHAKTKFSIKEWRKSGGVLVLGYDSQAESQSRIINYFTFLYAIQSVINAGPTKTDLSWFLLDEIKFMGKMDNLPNLLEVGRSAGARVVVTALGYDSLEQAFDKPANASLVLGQCPHQMYLPQGNAANIKKAVEQLGKSWVEQQSNTQTYGSNSDSRGCTTHMQEDDTVPYFLFNQLNYPNKDGLDAYFTSPHVFRPKPGQKMCHEEITNRLRPRCDTIKPYVPAPECHQHEVPWGAEDYEHFGFDPPPDNEGVKIDPEPDPEPDIVSGPLKYTHISKPNKKQ
ncbi:Type IV secretion-system coupling protein DNA-binding domain protein [Stieleria neptunia]|uniref:Type IV secretion-system coupling protein DNA-binding domain protein n=1 Tax=Stieleria neptunia TaxID=2527979 RepID=A0A518HT07_9BACT|nr:Type IV secretion-system coupling protein DNA-binding domain protein [Stieleria neptunia]